MLKNLADANRRFFSVRKNVRWYVRYNERAKLKPPEAKVLNELRSELQDKAILDLGVGAGRTTPYLRQISQNYIGADYSAAMVEACRRLFPGVTFVECDARKMDMFPDGQFDLVVFSYNGIDSNGPADRVLILREVYRVLRDNGVFFFSGLNRNVTIRRAHDLRNLRFTWNILRMPFRLAHYLQGIYNQARMRKYEVEAPDYSLRNVPDSFYTVVFHFSTPEKQIQQLHDIGFANVTAVNVDGEILHHGASETRHDIYYVARKRPVA